jgi:Na+-transporting methylmalonyl-CoA/oxaloacetate decarboxylase gamma subunit
MVFWDKIIAGQGFEIAFTGMTIVFSGLLLISLFIRLLPRCLKKLDKLTAKDSAQTAPLPGNDVTDLAATEEEIMAAIGLALHMELERCGGDMQQITIKRSAAAGSFWNSAGKMRSLSNRSPYA